MKIFMSQTESFIRQNIFPVKSSRLIIEWKPDEIRRKVKKKLIADQESPSLY